MHRPQQEPPENDRVANALTFLAWHVQFGFSLNPVRLGQCPVNRLWTSTMPDFYRILNLAPGADEEEIKKALNREMRLWATGPTPLRLSGGRRPSAW